MMPFAVEAFSRFQRSELHQPGDILRGHNQLEDECMDMTIARVIINVVYYPHRLDTPKYGC
jgi:hypothetical protein